MALNNLHDLFEANLMTMHATETAILREIDVMLPQTREPTLRSGMEMHREQTVRQIERIEQVARSLGRPVQKTTPHAFEGLVREKESVVRMDPNPEVLEVVNLEAAMKTERLEITCYEGMLTIAEQLGMTDVAQPLRENLQEEQAMLQRLTAFAQQAPKPHGKSSQTTSSRTGSSGR